MKTLLQHKHLLVCAGIVVIGLGAAVVGAKGLAALVVLACPLMMAAMAWGMLRGGARGG
jgi:hypothetical protein